MQEGGVGKF